MVIFVVLKHNGLSRPAKSHRAARSLGYLVDEYNGKIHFARANTEGLMTPAPVGVTFLDGDNEMSKGTIGYYRITCEPANYAFISEAPCTSEKYLIKTFEIPAIQQ